MQNKTRSGRFRSCSQIRNTRHPDFRSVRVTSLSRAAFAVSFLVQNGRLLCGILKCLGHACQKHPSTKTATLCFGNTKSGFPKTGRWRRQPVMPCCRINFTKTSSVALLPPPLTRDITSDRLALVNTSAMGGFCKHYSQFTTAFQTSFQPSNARERNVG